MLFCSLRRFVFSVANLMAHRQFAKLHHMKPNVLKWREPREAFSKFRPPVMWLIEVVIAAFLIWGIVRLVRDGWWLPLLVTIPISFDLLWLCLKSHIREFYTLSASGITMFPGRLRRHMAWRDLASFRLTPNNAVLLRTRAGSNLGLPLIALYFDPRTVDKTTLYQFLSDHLPETGNEPDQPVLDVAEPPKVEPPKVESPKVESPKVEPVAMTVHGAPPSGLRWKEPPPNHTPYLKLLGWSGALYGASFIAQAYFTGRPMRDYYFLLLLIGLVIHGGLEKTCRLDEKGIEVVNRHQRQRLPWHKVQAVYLNQEAGSAFRQMVVAGTRPRDSLVVRLDPTQISEQQIIALVRDRAPSADIHSLPSF